MKQHILLLLIATLLIAATYNEGDSFTYNKYQHNITSVIQDAVIIDTAYERVIIREGDCKVIDNHNWCVTNLTYDPVEHYPHEYEITINQERICSDCQVYGQACEENLECNGYCVHEICRPEKTYCGDGICDDNENCAADCPIQEENTTTINSTQKNTTKEQEDEETITQENTTTEITENTTQTETTLSQPTTNQNSVQEEPNYVGAGATLAIGIIALFAIIARHKKKNQPDLYSFK
jgi:hypothetical protein